MGAKSRNKGKLGERELFGLLSDLLGFVVKRNINARQGDCDSLELPGWAPEVKRVEKWEEIYWTQALDQAKAIGRRPVLFFRANNRPWVAMVDLSDITAYEVEANRYRAQLTLEGFAAFVREDLAVTAASLRLSSPPAGAITPVIPANGMHVIGDR